MSSLEIAANAATTLSIWLAARNSLHTWWTGIVGTLLFALLFYEAKLYADVTLQGFFIATSMVGWARWRTGDDGSSMPISRASPGLVVTAVCGGLAAAVGYGLLLDRLTDAYAPFWDSLLLMTSVIAQLLLMNRKIETWGFWLIVNSVAVPLFASRGLTLTAVLYGAYWINALFALHRWRRELASGWRAILP